jgi:hypothetical protein
MRRSFLSLLAALALCALVLSPAVHAQDATPVSGFDALGLPTLDVSVSMAGYEGIPATLEAGRYVVNLTASEDQEEGGTVAFVRPPEGMTADDFLAGVTGEPGLEAAASPMTEMEASPPAEEGALPSFIYQATFAGGISAPPGQTAQVVLDLGPGEWIAWPDGPGSSIPPVTFEVTGELPTDLPTPEASATLTMAEYNITVSEGTLAAGPSVIRIDNVGAQPHFLAWFSVPGGTTLDQVKVALDEEMTAEMTGTPVAYSGFNPDEDSIPVTFTGTQSRGTSVWIEVNVPAGSSILACFFPDISDGIPHAYHGMVNVVEVPS